MWFSKIINKIKGNKIKTERNPNKEKEVLYYLNKDWYLRESSALEYCAIYKKYPNIFIKFNLPIEYLLFFNLYFYIDNNRFIKFNVASTTILNVIKYKNPEELNQIAERLAEHFCHNYRKRINAPKLVKYMLLINKDEEYIMYTLNNNFIGNYLDPNEYGEYIFRFTLDPVIDSLITQIDKATSKK